jgi:hypothetical protein
MLSPGYDHTIQESAVTVTRQFCLPAAKAPAAVDDSSQDQQPRVQACEARNHQSVSWPFETMVPYHGDHCQWYDRLAHARM